MAFIGINCPHSAARLIHEIDVPGEKKDTSSFHITLLALKENIPIKELAKAMVATFEITEHIEPFWVKINNITCFPKKEGPCPIIAPAVSTKLVDVHKALKKSFDKNHIDYDKRFKEFKPHLTLASNENEVKKTKIEPIEWAVQELVLYGGDDGDDRVYITFPLDGAYNRI